MLVRRDHINWWFMYVTFLCWICMRLKFSFSLTSGKSNTHIFFPFKFPHSQFSSYSSMPENIFIVDSCNKTYRREWERNSNSGTITTTTAAKLLLVSHFLPSSLYLAALLLPDNCLLKTLLRCCRYVHTETKCRGGLWICRYTNISSQQQQWENNMFNLLSDLTLLMKRLSLREKL